MIGHLDCSTGVSGDKLLGAILDTGAATGRFAAEDLRRIVSCMAPEADVRVEHVLSHGIAAISVHVTADGEPHSRHLADVTALIEHASLPDDVASSAVRAFTLLAEAEAAIHGTTPDRVHFHEVGATDAIVDVVGVIAGLNALGVTSLSCTPVATGWGTVTTAHGVVPVPAPATLALLAGMPVHAGPAEGELTTPTGAVLLKTLAPKFGHCPPMTPVAAGYGAGTKDIGLPNVCRLTIGDPAADEALTTEQVALLETNVDHVSPEAVAFACEQLVAEGCLDVWVTPIVMKKGRPAMLLSALVPESEAEARAGRIVALTGTLGVRHLVIERFAAHREVRTVDTPFGPVRFKAGAGRMRPEHDDVARIARDTGQPYTWVAQQLVASVEE